MKTQILAALKDFIHEIEKKIGMVMLLFRAPVI